ncbi:hypothetical protein AAG570_001748 [Ranatra chinensis]|uniref:Golgi apparatus protein 1 n=1 Tax=Ranatra chinensis TaxID=642074 RepID=A0ABD0Y9E7_9HEMI
MFYHHEQLIVQDYQVSRGLVRMCKEDIRRNHCRKSVSSDKDIRLAQILICLENVTKNGTKVNNECLLEMLTHRKILMEDYRLSPELVSACSDNISQLCSGVETGGRTIHCLMEHTRTRRRKDRIAPQCQRQALLKEVDVASDWTVDPVLREACSDFVSNYCKGGYQSSSRVLSCLTEHLGSLQMSSECETAVLQIQYFVQRDYKLNSDLYRECRSDAITLCHAKRSWADDPSSMDPVRAPIVLPCLYRHALPPSNSAMPKLQRGCLVEVLRMMRQRALIVQLNPEVEQACIEDLAQHCSVKTGKGEEMLCLQDRLDSLSKSCRAAVSNYTELQSAHLIMNPIILSNCEDVISKLCENDVNAVTGGDALECLIEHKNDAVMRANPKCRAAVEHQQLISLKDFHFTFRFKDACQQQVSRFCNNARTKFEVVSCLSEIVRNDALADHKPHIPRECRQQLRAQLLQQRENIDLDPTLKEACKLDISRLCKNVARGNARVLECLESRRKNLTIDCYKRVFNIERQDLMDSSTDYTLLSTCKSMMIKYCSDKDPEKVFDCLKKFKYEAGFDAQCRLVIIKRMIEQNTDYRLNPALQKDCQQDIVKFCSEAIAALKKDDPKLEGKVIRCLKTKFRERKLSSSCENQLGVILKEAALNYELNPLLTMLCNTEINQFCKSEVEEDANKGKGRVEECLKAALLKGNIKNRVCRIELVELIEEGKADIQTDPLLFRACSQDISSHCSDVSKGNSRREYLYMCRNSTSKKNDK